jgi:DNA-binding transcriptional regulator YdaS (Cro superfamily)
MTNIAKAVEILGGAAAAARALGVSPQAVSFWLAGKRAPSAETCIAIERATSGEVAVEDLRPDIDWSVVRAPRASA